MLRKLTLILIPLALLVAAACGSDDSGDDSPDGATPQPSATEAIEPTSSPPGSDVEPTPVVIATADLGNSPIDSGDDDPSAIISALNPLGLLSGLDSATASDGVSGALAGQLLTANDVPSGYLPMGEFSMSIPTGTGTMDMAMNMFASADIVSTGELGSMVMSAAILLSPEARAEIGEDSLQALEDLSDADLEEIRAASGGMGFTITDLHLLDASGLGEGGAGIHMTMDLGSMGSPFGASEGAPPGLATDMFMFFEGDYMRMVMVMHPSTTSSGVDARALADALDNRA